MFIGRWWCSLPHLKCYRLEDDLILLHSSSNHLQILGLVQLHWNHWHFTLELILSSRNLNNDTYTKSSYSSSDESDQVNISLWPRFKMVFDMHLSSLRNANIRTLWEDDVHPHYVMRRYAEFTASLIQLNVDYGDGQVRNTRLLFSILPIEFALPFLHFVLDWLNLHIAWTQPGKTVASCWWSARQAWHIIPETKAADRVCYK